jgi:hypothetical protein
MANSNKFCRHSELATQSDREQTAARIADPGRKQRILYSLMESGIELVPLMAFMGSRGFRNALPSIELSARAQVLEDGGPQLWADFMDELRHIHLKAPAPEVSTLARMQMAYESSFRV